VLSRREIGTVACMLAVAIGPVLLARVGGGSWCGEAPGRVLLMISRLRAWTICVVGMVRVA